MNPKTTYQHSTSKEEVDSTQAIYSNLTYECVTRHTSLKAAYNCRKAKNGSHQLIASTPALSNLIHPVRLVTQDELILANLEPPTQPIHAFYANLVTHPIPKNQYLLTLHHKINLNISTVYDEVCFHFYLKMQAAILLHKFLTTPAPDPTEPARLLPLDLHEKYQSTIDPLVEAMLNLRNQYNELSSNHQNAPPLPKMLSYSLSPYRTKPKPNPKLDLFSTFRTEP